MNLDFYPRQNVVCIHEPNSDDRLTAEFYGYQLPVLNMTYTVREAHPCDRCRVHVSLEEIEPHISWPSRWFRPVEPKEMQKLRELLTPPLGIKEPA